MGSEETTRERSEMEDGITILKHKHDLIKRYFLNSSLLVNNMGLRCVKTVIPGKEIEKNSSFYVFNLEGFFDIENGFYFNLQELLKTIIILEKSKYNIKSYEELEYILQAAEVLNFLICSPHLDEFKTKFYNKENKGEKKMKSKKDIPTKETIKNNIGKFAIIFQEFIYTDNNSIITFSFLLRSFVKKLDKFFPNILKGTNNHFKKELNFLKKIIPFDDLKSLILEIIDFAENGLQIGFGVKNIIKGIAALPTNKFEGIFFLVEGAIGFIIGGVEMINQFKGIFNRKKEIKISKAQENLLNLLNRLRNLMFDLKQNDFKELYNNNIIILSIDETNDDNSEPLDIQLDNLEGMDNYTNSLNYNNNNRFNYIKKILEFYQLLGEKLNISDFIDEIKNLNEGKNNRNLKSEELEKKYFFMTYIKRIILTEYNNQDFWINVTKSQMEDLINESESNFCKILSKLGIKNINENKINNIIENEQKTKVRPNTITPKINGYDNENNCKEKDISIKENEKNNNNFSENNINNKNDFNKDYSKEDSYQNQIKELLIEKNKFYNKKKFTRFRRFKSVKKNKELSLISQKSNKPYFGENNKKMDKRNTFQKLKNNDIDKNNNLFKEVKTPLRSNRNFRIAKIKKIKDESNNCSLNDNDFPAPPSSFISE